MAGLVLSTPGVSRQVIRLEGQSDGLHQIAAALRAFPPVEAIHVVSHGDDGQLLLGDSRLDLTSMQGHHAEVLAAIGQGLTDTGDLLIYGCNFGHGAAGRAAGRRLAELTGADVAASDDLTGHRSRGGDWDLEWNLGRIETSVALNARGQASFPGVLAPTPVVSLNVPAQAFLGETISLSATFSNAGMSGETGFGPFVDLVFPVNGADGAAGSDTPDGLDFVSAAYLGSSINAVQITFPDDDGGGVGTTGTVNHPFARDVTGTSLQVTGTAGDKLVVLQLPFGSFAAGQPAVTIDIVAQLSNLADPYDAAIPPPNPTELELTARAGFMFGADALNNPTADPSIVSDAAIDSAAWAVNAPLQPAMLSMTKVYSGPENETATGPNFPRSYTIQAFLGVGQTVDDLTFTDLLPNTIEYAGGLVVTGATNFTVLQVPTTPGAQNPPNNDLVVRVDDPVTGLGPGAPAASLTFDFRVPLNAAGPPANNPVLDPLNGDDRSADNDASLVADWTPLDPRDLPAVTLTSDATAQDHTLQQKSIAIQKGVTVGNDTGTSGVTPGDDLEYTLDFQVSDFFAFNDVFISDRFGDGQDWFTTHPGHPAEVMIPTLEFTEHGATVAAAPFSAANYTVTENADGTTSVRFDVSQELIDRAGGAMDAGELLGGWIPALGTGIGQPDGSFDGGPTSGRIVFRTRVLEDYKDPQGNDQSVDQGDDLMNTVSIDGALLNVDDLSVRGTRETDDSSANTTIVTGTLSKSIYAINGTINWQPIYDLADANGMPGTDGNPELEAGDLVTYRLEYDLPTSDVEDFELVDFLPLPVFDATDLNPVRGLSSAAPPGENRWHLHPADTFTTFFEANASSFFGATSAVEIVGDANSNSFAIQFGTVDDPASGARKLDILFTVPITPQPAADGLLYTNQAQTIENNTFGGQTINQVISMQDVVVYQPDLTITKGAVSTSSGNGVFTPAQVGPVGVSFEVPGSTNPAFVGQIDSPGLAADPIDSDVDDLDAGDLVKFAIVLQNTGSADAYDITVADVLPAGLQIPTNATGLNLEVRDGNGNLLEWTGVDTSSDVDLFGGGIEIFDPIAVYLASNLTDELTLVSSRDNFDPATNEQTVGSLGAADIEAIVRNPLDGVLFGADADALGTINLTTGAFSPVGGTLGTGTGSLGPVTFSDVDGLAFHPVSGELYGVHDNGAQNVIFKIDTSTGSHVNNAFGGTDDYIALNIATQLNDIAIDRSGTIFTTDATNLIRVDLDEAAVSGTLTTIGAHAGGIADMEGLSTDENGRLWGTTGADDGVSERNRLWEISKIDGAAGNPRQLDNGGDYEGSESYHPGETGAIGDLRTAQSLSDGSNVIIITYDLQLSSTVVAGGQYSNNATLTNYASLDAGPDHSLIDPRDDATVGVATPVPTKSLVDTSEAHTTGTNVAIGEIIRYRLVAEIPEGTLTNFQFDDRLPTGMRFLDDGTARVAFISNGGGITSNETVGALNLALGTAPAITGNAPTAPVFALPDANVGSDASTSSDPDVYIDSTDPQFKLGDIVNADNDADSEYLVVEFNAIVSNESFQNGGDSRSNTVGLSVDGTTLATSGSVAVDVVEPNIGNVTKTASATSGDAGDTITFTVGFSNTGNTNAFDLRLLDPLRAEYALNLASVNIVPVGATGITNNSAGNNVDVTVDDIPVGGSVTVTYDVVLLVDVEPGEVLQNAATITFTGLPGPNGTTSNPTGSATPGASGSVTGERDGSGGHNDYTDTATRNVTVDSPGIAKLLAGTGIVNGSNAVDEAVIGETVQYSVQATIPEGTINAAQVVDTLDAGLEFVSLDVIVTSAGVTSSDLTIALNSAATIPVTLLGQTVTFDFANLTNSNSSNGTPETISLLYTARVRNVAGNQGEGTGTMLNNSAAFAWEENLTPRVTASAAAAEVEVIEPALSVTKLVNTPAADAGDTMVYTITIQHAGGSDTDAFDVTFTDAVPPEITYAFPANVTATHSSLGDISGAFQMNGNTLETIPGSSFDLLLAENVVITVTGLVNVMAVPGQTLNNSATLDWSSLDGANPNERDGSDGQGGVLDDYELTSTAASTTISSPTLAKSLFSTSIISANNALNEAVIGETAQYQLTLTMPESTIPSSVFVDNLDLGLEFVNLNSVAALSGGIPTAGVTSSVDSFGNTGSFSPSVTGDGLVTPQQLTFDFGTLANNNTVNADVESLVLTYTVRVTNIAANTSNGAGVGTLLDNSAMFSWDENGTPRSTATVDAADIEVIEPSLAVSKTVNTPTADAGDTVTFMITVRHAATSDADAFDVTFTDAIPPEITYVFPAGVTATHSTLGDITGLFQMNGNTLETIPGSSFDLALTETVVITVNGLISVAAVPGQTLTNTATADWSSLDGADPNERDGSDGQGGPLNDYEVTSAATSTTIISPALGKSLVATSIINPNNTLNEVVIGETAQYQLTLAIPESTIPSSVFVDNLDLGLEFVSLNSVAAFSAGVPAVDVTSSVDSFGNTGSFSPSVTGDGLVTPQQLTFDFGTLANNNTVNADVESLVLTYTVRVTNIAANTSNGAGVGTLLDNSAMFSWDENGTPRSTATVDAADIEVIEPSLAVSKTVNTPTADAGDTVTFMITVRHAATSDADAFDVTFTDAIPPEITYVFPAGVTATHSTLGDITGLFQMNGNTLETIPGSSFDLALTETVVITVNGLISVAAVPGQTLTNTATADWSSLDGADPNERDGSDGQGGPLNDYEVTSAATSTTIISPALGKSLVATSIINPNNTLNEVVIGETAQYQLTLAIPESTIPSSVFVDNLDLGLEFVSLNSVAAFSAGVPAVDVTSSVDSFGNTGSFSPSVTGDGLVTPQQLTFDFGTLANNNTVNADVESLVLTYTVRVTNIAANTSNGAGVGTLLDNSAMFSWDENGTPRSTATVDAADVEVIEPVLNVAKSVDDDTPFLGQVVSYTLTINHTSASDADAHDLVVTDALPSDLTLDLGTLTVVGATIISDASAGNNISLVLDQLALGNTISITYDATVTTNLARIGAVVMNTIATTWTSLPDGTSAGPGPERDGDGGSGGQDDYIDSANESATITHPDVQLTKTLIGGPVPASSGTDGNFDITYDLLVVSTGNDSLFNLSLVEDLATQYGGALVRIVPQGAQPAAIVGSTATDDPEINPAFDGGVTDAELIDNSGGNTNRLDAGETVTIRLIIEVDPNSPTASLSSGDLVNQATVTVTGLDSSVVVNDLSDDPNDPTDAENDVPPDTEPDDPNRVRIANLSLTKRVFGSPTPAASGTAGNFDVFYDLTISNAGSTPLDSLTLTEDLVTNFGGAFASIVLQAGLPAVIVASTAADDPGINPGYDGGATDSQIFDGSSSLLNVNESITIRLLVEVDPDNAAATYDGVSGDSSGDLENQATASGQDPANPGTPVSDTSDDPTDVTNVDPNSDNDPDDPTGLLVPSIDLTKTLIGTPTPAASGTAGNFDVVFDLAITNTGNESLSMLSLTEDLSAEYGGAFVGLIPQAGQPATIQASTATDAPEINAAYDGGTSDAQLFDNSGNTNLLAVGQSVTVRIVIEVDPDNATAILSSGDLLNQARVVGTSAVSSTMISDDSDDPNDATNADPNADNNPDDPNRLSLPNITIDKIVSAAPTPAASGTPGNVDVTYQLTVTNTGSEQLTNFTLSEDLWAQLGGAFVGLNTTPLVCARRGAVAPNLNGSYDGGISDASIIDGISGELDPGETYTMTLSIEVDPDSATAIYVNGRLENQATAGGTDEHSVTVTDESDDPFDLADIDPNADNNPDDPTAISIADIEVTKSVGPPMTAGSGAPGNIEAAYQFVITNTGSQSLMNLSLVEDFAANFGGGFVTITGIPTIAASGAGIAPTLNVMFDGGITDANVFDGMSGAIAPGEMITVNLTVELDPDNPTAIKTGSNFVNQAIAGGEDQNLVSILDLSDDPADPTDVETETPADNEPDDPTVLHLPSMIASKRVLGTPLPASSGIPGNFEVSYQINVTNNGSNTLRNLTILEDFATQFGGSFVGMVGATIITPGLGAVIPVANLAYDGGLTDASVLDGTSGELEPGEAYVVRLTVEVDADADPAALVNGSLLNQVTVGASDPNGIIVSDDSDDPTDLTDVDPDLDGDPDDPTSVRIPDITLTKTQVGTPIDAASGTTGNYDVTYDLSVTNTGSTPLTSLSLVEDLVSQFGAAFVAIVSQAGQPATRLSSSAADDPEINVAFDGGVTDAQIFDSTLPNTNQLDPGQSVTVRIVVEVDLRRRFVSHRESSGRGRFGSV